MGDLENNSPPHEYKCENFGNSIDWKIMKNHDPREQVRGLHQILTSDKKRTGFLFGAGTSFATGISGICVPAIAKMTDDIVQHVTEQSTALASAINGIEAELISAKIAFNIESLLSSIESKWTSPALVDKDQLPV
jgi:hypothetical protein